MVTARTNVAGQAELKAATRARVVSELESLIAVCSLSDENQQLCGMNATSEIVSVRLSFGSNALRIHVRFRAGSGLGSTHAERMAQDISRHPILAHVPSLDSLPLRSISAVAGCDFTFAPTLAPTASPASPSVGPTPSPSSSPSAEPPIQVTIYFSADNPAVVAVTSGLGGEQAEFELMFRLIFAQVASGICAALRYSDCFPAIDWVGITYWTPNSIQVVTQFAVGQDRMRSAEGAEIHRQFQNGNMDMEVPTSFAQSPFRSGAQVDWNYGTTGPTGIPTVMPAVSAPTVNPTATPTADPTANPTASPSTTPTPTPTTTPSATPTPMPSASPSAAPTRNPSTAPSAVPSGTPTAVPSGTPSAVPTPTPTATPTATPTPMPSASPSAAPTRNPSTAPSAVPSGTPTAVPSGTPSTVPTVSEPTGVPTASEPTGAPTASEPTGAPTASEPTTTPTAPTSAPTHGPSLTPVHFTATDCGLARTDCTSGDAASYNPVFIRCIRTASREGHCWCAPPFQCSAGSPYYGCDSPGASCLSTNLQPSTPPPPTPPPTDCSFEPFIQVELSGTVRVLNVTFNSTVSTSVDSRLNFKSAVSERALLVAMGEITTAQLLAMTLEQRLYTSYGVATVAVTASMVFDDTVTIATAQIVAASYVSEPMTFEGKGYRAVRTSLETHNLAETTQSNRPTASRITSTAPSVAPTMANYVSTTAAATESDRAASATPSEDEDTGILIAVAVIAALLLVIIVIWRVSESQQTQSTNLALPPMAAPASVNMASFSLEGDNLDVTKTVTSFNNPVYAPYMPVQPSMGMPGNPSPMTMGASSSMMSAPMPPPMMGMGWPMSAPPKVQYGTPTANAYSPGPMMTPGGAQMSFVGTPGGGQPGKPGLPYWRQ